MRLLIYGSRDFARTVADLIRHCGHDPVGMIDDFRRDGGVLGGLDEVATSHPARDYGVAIAIGYSDIPARWRAWERVRAAGYRAPALVHPRAYVADTARIGEGVMVMAGAIVDTRAELDDLAVVWPGACVNHDARVGRNSFISPNATLCGHSQVGRDSFVGAAAAIADHGELPPGSFLKMLGRYAGGPQ